MSVSASYLVQNQSDVCTLPDRTPLLFGFDFVPTLSFDTLMFLDLSYLDIAFQFRGTLYDSRAESASPVILFRMVCNIPKYFGEQTPSPYTESIRSTLLFHELNSVELPKNSLRLLTISGTLSKSPKFSLWFAAIP